MEARAPAAWRCNDGRCAVLSPFRLPGTFSLCTFLYAVSLARSGRIDDGRITFSKMLTYANHVGLFSEEIDATGRQVGNFPQAFTHLALVAAALNLDREMDHHEVE
jgi:GH15 family glucan-1,4-alpha-glucosidase